MRNTSLSKLTQFFFCFVFLFFWCFFLVFFLGFFFCLFVCLFVCFLVFYYLFLDRERKGGWSCGGLEFHSDSFIVIVVLSMAEEK